MDVPIFYFGAGLGLAFVAGAITTSNVIDRRYVSATFGAIVGLSAGLAALLVGAVQMAGGLR